MHKNPFIMALLCVYIVVKEAKKCAYVCMLCSSYRPPVPEAAKIPLLKSHEKLLQNYKWCIFFFFFFKKDSNNRSLAVQMKREPRLLPFPALIMASFIVFIFLSKWAMKERWRHRFCHFTAPCCLIGHKPCVCGLTSDVFIAWFQDVWLFSAAVS